MKCVKLFFVLVLCIACLVPAVAQTTSQEALTELSSNISEELQNLKREITSFKEDSTLMTSQLKEAYENLKLSENEREKWENESTALSISIMNISDKLNSSYERITILEAQKTRQTKALAWLSLILLLLIIMKLVGYVLYAKGIKLPRWLDILL